MTTADRPPAGTTSGTPQVLLKHQMGGTADLDRHRHERHSDGVERTGAPKRSSRHQRPRLARSNLGTLRGYSLPR